MSAVSFGNEYMESQERFHESDPQKGTSTWKEESARSDFMKAILQKERVQDFRFVSMYSYPSEALPVAWYDLMEKIMG